MKRYTKEQLIKKAEDLKEAHNDYKDIVIKTWEFIFKYENQTELFNEHQQEQINILFDTMLDLNNSLVDQVNLLEDFKREWRIGNA